MAPRKVKKATPGRFYVRALARGLETLKALANDNPDGMTLSDVACTIDLDRATARRFLLTLAEIGYVRTNGKTFQLSPQVLELGFSYFSSMPIWDNVQPILNQYSENVRGAFSIGVLAGEQVIYVARAQSRRSIYSLNVSIGSKFPVYCSSIGRVLLAGLSDDEVKALLKKIDLIKRTPYTRTKLADIISKVAEARQAGFSISYQETEVGICSIAVPIFDRKGTVMAGFNASVQASLVDERGLVRDYLPQLQKAAAQVQAAMQLTER